MNILFTKCAKPFLVFLLSIYGPQRTINIRKCIASNSLILCIKGGYTSDAISPPKTLFLKLITRNSFPVQFLIRNNVSTNNSFGLLITTLYIWTNFTFSGINIPIRSIVAQLSCGRRSHQSRIKQ